MPIRKWVIYNKVFILLIDRCGVSFPMSFIGANRVELTMNIEPISIILNTF